MSELWIKASGQTDEAGLPALVQGYAAPGQCCLAFYTGGFAAAAKPLLNDLPDLLELRIFDAQSELWVHRTMVGAPFAWRIADDATLEQNAAAQPDPFLQQPGHHRLPVRQTLDIDTTYHAYQRGETDANGCLKLRTTVGGCYALPLAPGQDTALLASYLHYDEAGAATVADTRLCGFATAKEAEAYVR